MAPEALSGRFARGFTCWLGCLEVRTPFNPKQVASGAWPRTQLLEPVSVMSTPIPMPGPPLVCGELAPVLITLLHHDYPVRPLRMHPYPESFRGLVASGIVRATAAGDNGHVYVRGGRGQPLQPANVLPAVGGMTSGTQYYSLSPTARPPSKHGGVETGLLGF